jgi:hypothetical protein
MLCVGQASTPVARWQEVSADLAACTAPQRVPARLHCTQQTDWALLSPPSAGLPLTAMQAADLPGYEANFRDLKLQ